MERDANYAAVGAFVLLVVVMAGLFVYWYTDKREHRDYVRYEVYFDGSVSGLARGSQVRYLGVDVGRVVEMRIDPRKASRVQVIVDVDSSAPISSRTVAELSLQGVTGLLFIDLKEVSSDRGLPDLVQSERYPVIRAGRSNFDAFVASLPDFVAVATDVIGRADRILSDQNIASVSAALANINRASAQLPATVHDVEVIATELRGAAGQINAAAHGARVVTDTAGPEIIAAVKRVREVADNLAQTSAALSELVADNRQGVRSFTHESLPELDRLVHDSRAAAQEIRGLSESLHENPSQLLYQPPRGGVEIPP